MGWVGMGEFGRESGGIRVSEPGKNYLVVWESVGGSVTGTSNVDLR